MPIDKINNIVSFQIYKNSKPISQEKNISETSYQDENFGKIIPLELIATYNGNIILNSKIKQIEDFLNQFKLISNKEEIKNALQKYYADFPELTKVFPQGKRLYEEFIEAIKNTDFEGLEKIESFYGFGVKDETERAYCESLGVDPATITTNESYEIISDLITSYARIFSEKTPYSVLIYKDEKGLCEQIEIEKDGATIVMQPMIFYNIALFKKPFGENIIMLPFKEDDEYKYSYTTKSHFGYKINQSNNHTIGCISEEDIDKNNQPKCLLDSQMESGITYYIMAEKFKTQDSDISVQNAQIQNDEDLYGLYEAETYSASLEEVLQLIQQDKFAKEYFEEGVDPKFLVTCIRNGQFNNNVFEAKDRLYCIIEESIEEDRDFSEEYVEQLFYIIEKEDNTFDMNAIDVVASIFLKDLNSEENFEKLNYEIASFIKENPDDKNADSLLKISQNQTISLEDTKILFNILKTFNSGELIEAKRNLEDFIQSKSNDDQEYKENTKLYNSFFKGYLKI